MNELAPRPSQQGIPSHGLMSLLDMVKFVNAGALAILGKMSHEFEVSLGIKVNIDEGNVENKTIQVGGVDEETADQLFNMLQGVAESFNLTDISRKIERRRKQDTLPLNIQFRDLLEDLIDALDTNQFMYVTPDRASFLSDAELLSSEVKDAFPEVNSELVEAGKCYALNRSTAAVFHSMRAVEAGVKSICSGLNLPIKEHDDLKKAVDGIRKLARQIEEKPHYPGKKDDSKYYSELALNAGLFKDAWRNYVAHAKVTYNEEDALKIVNAVRDFYEKIVTRPAP